MKRLKGLYQDCDPFDQPLETYRDAINVSISQELGAIVSEQGNQLRASLPAGYIPIGHVLLADQRIIIFSSTFAGNSEIGSYYNGTYTTILNDSNLGFSPARHIEATHRLDTNSDVILYWTDNSNPPRTINIDTLTSYTDVNELNIFDYISSVADISLSQVNNYGGNVVSGMYIFALRYVDVVGNKTNFTSFSNEISIVRDIQNDTSFFIEGNATASTSKSISLAINNLDTSFDRYQLAVIRYQNGAIAEVSYLPEESISQSNQTFTYTNTETSTVGSISDVAINRASYATAKAITQSDDNLFLANLTRKATFDYQPYALNIKTELVTKRFDETDEDKFQYHSGDETLVYYNRNFQREEVYAFYISFILNDGSESFAFHIPGRAPLSHEIVNITPANSQAAFDIDPTAKYYQFFADKEPSTGMAYWENENETYPDESRWQALDIDNSGSESNGTDYRTLNVRHHRFPSADEEGIVNYDSADGGVFTDATVLGVKFSNIKIPTSIANQVKAFKIYYAKKDRNNKLVIDQAGAIAQKEVSSKYENDLTDFNVLETKSNINAIALHPFNSLRTRGSLASVTHLRKVANTKVGDVRQVDAARKVVAHLPDHDYIAKSSASYIERIGAITYIDAPPDGGLSEVLLGGVGFRQGKTNTREESQVLVESYDTTVANQFDLTQNPQGGQIFGALYNLMSLRKDVHNSFDLQELVWTGITETNIDNFTPSLSNYGEVSRGELTITSAASGTAGGTSATASQTFGGTAIKNYTMSINYAGIGAPYTDTDVSIANGDDGVALATKAEAAINADSNAPVMASRSGATLTYTAKVAGTAGEGILISPIGDGGIGLFGTGNTLSPDDSIVTAGASSGSILRFTVNGNTICEAELENNDTIDEIADKLVAGASIGFSVVHDGGTGGRLLINSVYSGTEFNGSISDTVNGDSITFTSVAMSGGADTLNFTEDNFGGDTFISNFGYRVVEDNSTTPNIMLLIHTLESVDNINFRESGSELSQLNGNNPDTSKQDALIKLEEDDGLSDDDNWYDNYYGYDDSHSIQFTLAKTTPYPKNFTDQTDFPTRVIRSQNQSDGNTDDSFRVFLENDFMDLSRERGVINKLIVIDNYLNIHMDRAIYRTKGREELPLGDNRVFIGSGDIFAVEPDEFISTEEGFAGLQDVRAGINTPFGYFFVDRLAKEVFLLGSNIKKVSDQGLRNYFDDNLDFKIQAAFDDVGSGDHNSTPYVGYALNFDPEYNRILLTKVDYEPTALFLAGTTGFNSDTGKFTLNGPDVEFTNTSYFTDKSFTVSYHPELNIWASFHSYTPWYGFRDVSKFYTVDSNDIYSHDSATPCNFYGSSYDMEYEFVENRDPDIMKQFENIEFIADAYETNGFRDTTLTFDQMRASNDYQDSGIVAMPVASFGTYGKRWIEGKWFFANFRDLLESGTVNPSLAWNKRKKFIGKFLKVRLYYTPENNQFLNVLSVKANYRPSLR